jgi:mRNA m6A methyltransferase catalytic subunit
MVPPNTRGPLSLPSGLGAGGRGKEKAPCRYLHYEVDWDGGDVEWKREGRRVRKKIHKLDIGLGPAGKEARVVGLLVYLGRVVLILLKLPPQWINCDLRSFDYSVLGKFHVIMADPPWDIHMSVSVVSTTLY